MVAIAPFKAIRYNPSKITNLSKVICPPYDVISVPEYHRLTERHPANLVRVELPLAQGKEDRYALAASHWKRWQSQRLLAEDKEPGFYGYEQRFSVGGKTYLRRGFFAAMRLEEPGKGDIRPHERTFPKHKEDRLHLMQATHANISPIFGIFFDRRKKAEKLLAERMEEKPLITARDDKGVTHRLWRWTDAEAISVFTDVVGEEDVLIADGHHRYETAWNYLKGLKGKVGTKAAPRYVMTFLCPLADSGLVIQPTHRSVSSDLPFEEWQKRVGTDFTMEKISSLKPLLSRLRADGEHDSLAMVIEGGRIFWIKPKGNPKYSLPVVFLHEKLLKDIPLENISYNQDARQVIQAIHRGEAQIGFLLPPPDKEAFARICRGGKLLPQKSTYFYPKVGTGLVMRSLDGNIA